MILRDRSSGYIPIIRMALIRIKTENWQSRQKIILTGLYERASPIFW